MKPITVSIVSHGQAALALPLLAQLSALCAPHIERVVLTLNLPESVDLTPLGLQFPVTTLLNAVPKGFGANHNQAFLHCESDWFLVLNPDIELTGDALGDLLANVTGVTDVTDVTAHARVAVIAPWVTEPPRPGHTPERDVITPWEVFVGQRLSDGERARPVWFPGLFMLCRAEAFRAVTGFDERFFMYCEDFDLCARLGLAGWGLRRDSRVTVVHRAQRDSHARLRYLRWHVGSLLRLWASATFWRYWWAVRRRA